METTVLEQPLKNVEKTPQHYCSLRLKLPISGTQNQVSSF